MTQTISVASGHRPLGLGLRTAGSNEEEKTWAMAHVPYGAPYGTCRLTLRLGPHPPSPGREQRRNCEMKKRMLSLLCVLALCLGLLPVTALAAAAPSRQVIYVGNTNVTSGGYWMTDSDGDVTAYTGEGTPADKFIHYDAGNNVLTLHNATIKESLDYNGSNGRWKSTRLNPVT